MRGRGLVAPSYSIQDTKGHRNFQLDHHKVLRIICQKLDHHMELHYSQTVIVNVADNFPLDHHMELHYSQTDCHMDTRQCKLDHHMELHYSQTKQYKPFAYAKLDHHMELHYSQTYHTIQ